jgi:translation initiation factor 1 (eIF-1/SUI1)
MMVFHGIFLFYGYQVIYGLDMFPSVKTTEFMKACKKKYSCGVSSSQDASKRDYIEIQGDRKHEVCELLRDEWAIPTESLFIMEDKKTKRPAF